MTIELHRKLGDTMSFFAVHPGAVATELLRYYPKTEAIIRFFLPLLGWYFKTPELGAQTSINCAVAENMDQYSGEYFAECRVENRRRTQLSRDLGLAKKLWEKSEELTGISYPF